MHQLCVNYRKVLRRTWNVPWRTHSNLLPHISNSLPLEVSLEKRFVNFFVSSYGSNNPVLSSVFKQAVYSYSRIGRNLSHVNLKYDLNVIDEFCLRKHNVNAKITDTWKKLLSINDIRIGAQVRELAFARDAFDPWLLERQECQYIIDYLCVI
jgi:hypothetical protein